MQVKSTTLYSAALKMGENIANYVANHNPENDLHFFHCIALSSRMKNRAEVSLSPIYIFIF
jgi:hypothetical protein